MPAVKRAPQAKPTAVKAAAARKAALRAVGETFERYDAAAPDRSNVRALKRPDVATSKRRGVQTLGRSEIALPGRLTKDGRKGARIVRRSTLYLEPGRHAAVEALASKRSEGGPRVTFSQIIAEALARAGIGGKFVDGESG